MEKLYIYIQNGVVDSGERNEVHWSALTEERVLWKWLLEVLAPCCQIRITISLDVAAKKLADRISIMSWHLRVDVFGRGEVWRIATDVLGVLWLIDSNIIDSHMDWERDILKIHLTKLSRHSQVHQDILPKTKSAILSLN